MEETKNIQELLNNKGNHSVRPRPVGLPRASDLEITLASISPLLSPRFGDPISEECKKQSLHYLSELYDDKSWAKRSMRKKEPM